MIGRLTKHVARRSIDGVWHGVAYETLETARSARIGAAAGSNDADPDGGDEDADIVLCHAAGFCKEVWHPVIRELQQGLGITGATFHALDFSGHGGDGSGTPLDGATTPSGSVLPPGSLTWHDFGKDVVAVCDDITRRRLRGGGLSAADASNGEAHSSDCGSSGGDSGTLPTRGRRHLRIGVGHSLGGASAVLAELLRPGLFDRIVLIEPILLGPPDEQHNGAGSGGGSGGGNARKSPSAAAAARKRTDHPLYTSTVKRRNGWASREEAAKYLATRGAFRKFTPEAIAGFVAGGLVHDESSSGVRLACRPEFEAHLYLMGKANVWARDFAGVAAPVQFVAGETSTHLSNVFGNGLPTTEYCALLSSMFPHHLGDPIIVPRTSHFVVMERPRAVAEIVAAALRGSGGGGGGGGDGAGVEAAPAGGGGGAGNDLKQQRSRL